MTKKIGITLAGIAAVALLAACNPNTTTAEHVSGGCSGFVTRHWLNTYTGPTAANITVTVANSAEQRIGWVNPGQQFTVYTDQMGGCTDPSSPQVTTQINVVVKATNNTGALVGDLAASGTKDCWPGDVSCLTAVPHVNSGPSPA